jgi:hypothetical protein
LDIRSSRQAFGSQALCFCESRKPIHFVLGESKFCIAFATQFHFGSPSFGHRTIRDQLPFIARSLVSLAFWEI